MRLGNFRRQFKATLKGGARKGEVSERPKTIHIQYDSIRTSKKKGKSNDKENLDSSCSFVQAEESENSANTLNIESISKSENWAKLSIVVASSNECADEFAYEYGKKFDM